ncbi:MAG: ribonuclease D [Armatimonadetes bacterium]|nr:ribonuclease D [Armatimonadota bacterium]
MKMNPKTPPLIDTQAAFDEMMRDAERAPVLGMDAEMDSYFSYYPKLCMMQLSTPEADYLIDPLARMDLAALGEVTANPDQVKIFHAGANDVPYFRRALGYEFVNIFDTHVTARILGMPRSGLASLLEEYFDVRLDKQYQRADWRLRPLPPGQADYARLDTRYLLPLREELLSCLEEEGKLEEAASEFERVCQAQALEKEFDPDAWARVKGVLELPRDRRAMFRQLHLWREDEARREDVAPFRVLPDGLMVALAARRPRNRTDLLRFSKHPALRRHADELLGCLEQGWDEGPISLPERKSRSTPMTRSHQKNYDRLRQWRNELSEKQSVDPDRIASNRLLRRIAEAEPSSLEQLSQVEGMEPWRLSRHGDSILKVIRSREPGA